MLYSVENGLKTHFYGLGVQTFAPNLYHDLISEGIMPNHLWLKWIWMSMVIHILSHSFFVTLTITGHFKIKCSFIVHKFMAMISAMNLFSKHLNLQPLCTCCCLCTVIEVCWILIKKNAFWQIELFNCDKLLWSIFADCTLSCTSSGIVKQGHAFLYQILLKATGCILRILVWSKFIKILLNEDKLL